MDFAWFLRMAPLDSVADVETPNEALVFWICDAVNYYKEYKHIWILIN